MVPRAAWRPRPFLSHICENESMCNRYSLKRSKAHLANHFQASDESGEIEDRPRYNIAPTQPVIAVRREHGKKARHLTTMRWGLIPSWATDMSIETRPDPTFSSLTWITVSIHTPARGATKLTNSNLHRYPARMNTNRRLLQPCRAQVCRSSDWGCRRHRNQLPEA